MAVNMVAILPLLRLGSATRCPPAGMVGVVAAGALVEAHVGRAIGPACENTRDRHSADDTLGAMEGTGVLEVDGVEKRYGDRVALDAVSLSVAPGEVCGLLGPNGAGKTTLVSIVAGLRSADAGTVHVDGVDVAKGGRKARSAVGLAAQETSIYPTVTVRENLELFARLAGLSGTALWSRIEDVADVVELTHLLDRLGRNLSGGEKRRLHTAMALVHRPRVLLLDEPTTGVDIATRSRLLAAISSLAAEEGCAIVYSTHYLPEITELGASVAVLDHGRVLARGPLNELVNRHGSGMVSLTFDGPVPAVADSVVDGCLLEGDTLRVTTDRPGATVATVMARLGPEVERVVSLDLVQPSLETVFMAVTGRVYRSEDGSVADDGPVASDGPTASGATTSEELGP
jgi:ABC-2 type transport system ATP-binding protein